MLRIKFTNKQLDFIKGFDEKVEASYLVDLFSKAEVNSRELVLILTVSNGLYRAGIPLLSDKQYDLYLSMLRNINHLHPYLHQVEPEALSLAKTIDLPSRMLSTDKAYSQEDIGRWLKRILKAAKELGVLEVDIQIRVTPKLDGYAAYDDGVTLYTRGDGYKGQDITRAFDRGLKVANNGLRGLGPGEIVIKKSYFDKFLSVFFENSRNIQAAIIAEKNVDSHVQKAIDDGACVFYPFELLKNRTEHFSVIMSHFDEVIHSVWGYVGYDIDGVVLEVTNEKIKQYMGATRRHHRWQIAFKINDDSADVKVINVIPQTSRTGRVSPVAKLVPTKLSGVTISRVTVHHYRMVLENGVGSGATVRIIRSGLVIPKIEKVIKKVTPHIPSHCPSCNSLLVWEADHLVCTNKGDCPAQTENTLMYFFKMLGNNDGFGPKVIEKLNNFGIKYIHEIYSLTENDFIQYGFGEKTSQNLVDQLKSSRKIEVEDWRFLAAFGISRLGAGNCEKLLGHYSLVNVFDLGVDEVMSIDGFGQVSAQAITSGLLNMKEEFFQVYSLGFTIRETLNLIKKGIISPISDMLVVFSGTMKKKSRRDMEEEAKSLGAKVAKSVTGKTKYLVIGDRVGETKLTSAKDLGVEILSEQDYINLIESYI